MERLEQVNKETLYAFPSDNFGQKAQPGMPLAAYAAIHLRVPESGIDWLDAMIEMARKDQFAGMALQGILAWPGDNQCGNAHSNASADQVATTVCAYADAMLASRKPSVEACEHCGGCGMLAGKEPDDDVMNTPCPRCNPNAEPEWIQHVEGGCPAGEGEIGDVKFRDGDVSTGQKLSDHDWRILGTGNDIIAYRIGGKP